MDLSKCVIDHIQQLFTTPNHCHCFKKDISDKSNTFVFKKNMPSTCHQKPSNPSNVTPTLSKMKPPVWG